MKKVIIHTDGSCLGNPGDGGWAAILQVSNVSHTKEICGGFGATTNNRMEMMGVIEGLLALKEPCIVEVFSDSQYVCNSVKKGWLNSWIKNNWIKSDKKPVKNQDLWEKFIPLLAKHEVKFTWVKGHNGHVLNERCDVLAREQASRHDLPKDTGISG